VTLANPGPVLTLLLSRGHIRLLFETPCSSTDIAAGSDGLASKYLN
jgi:hypothetical protein